MKTRLALFTLVLAFVAVLIFGKRPSPAPPSVPPSPASHAARPKFPGRFSASAPAPAESAATNLTRLALRGEPMPKLTAAQVEGYIHANHRSAESLLAALYATGDHSFLREAMEKHPEDPKVNFAAFFLGDLPPEEKRKWAENFKRADPDNSMTDYASALDYLKSGQTDLALQDMAAAATKSRWTDYSQEFLQSSEEAYRAAGYSDLDARIAAETQLLLPAMSSLKTLGVKLGDLAKSYQQAGDSASAQATLQMDLRIGQQLTARDAQPLITTLVGYAVERIGLTAMDPGAPYDKAGRTVQDRLDEIQQQRATIKSLVGQTEGLLNQMPEQDVLTYFERRRSFGELNAIRWAAGKYGTR